MVHAPSGQLVLPCDGYEALADGGQDEAMTFITDHTTPTTTSGIDEYPKEIPGAASSTTPTILAATSKRGKKKK